MAPGVKHPKRGEGLELWLKGHSLKHIAVLLGVSDRSVRDWRDRDGWPERDESKVLPQRYSDSRRRAADAEFESVKDELAVVWKNSFQPKTIGRTNGVVMQGSAERVGEHFGWSPSKANDFLKRAGLLKPRPSNKTHGARVVELFESGWSIPRIATELEVTRDSVRNWLSARGVDISATHFTERMSAEEHRAWRDSIRIARAPAEVINSRFKYRGVPMDSTYEVRFAKHCDQIGLEWKRYDRTLEGALVEYGDGALYAPDFIIGLVYVETKGYYTPKDQAKVRAWRELKGHLSLVTHVELADFERITDANEAVNFLEACLHNDPDPEEDLR